MSGSKATGFEALAKARGQAYLRFDYSGHGQSEGDFNDGTIGQWASDAIAILDHVAKGPAVLVGSSMGGWMAFLTALARPQRIYGMIGIAAAPDFTEEIYRRLDAAQKNDMREKGFAMVENDYSNEPYYFSQHFYEEAETHLILNKNHRFSFPVHLFQGMRDIDVPPQTVAAIMSGFAASNITATYIEDGDHRLSRPEDIALIDSKIREMSA